MKAMINDNCTGCGTCEDICPEVFEVTDDSARVKEEEIPENLQESCRQAAEECPVEAIDIEE